MKKQSNYIGSSILIVFLVFFAVACSEKDITVGNITIAEQELNKNIAWDEVESSISFVANDKWTAVISNIDTRVSSSEQDWIVLTVSSGGAGDTKMPFVVTKNDNEHYREARIIIKCGEKTSTVVVHQEANPDAVRTMNIKQIPDYNQFYCPGTWNEGFEKGSEGMLRSDAKWSWWRYKSSEHFFVFWEPGFGSDPNAETIPEALRVDVDDLLLKAEQFYKTNIEKLGMATVGEGKSVLDKYKMEIFLLYQTEWFATGSGYDDMIGALWVNPSTCKPVGSTIAHEIGHSFQYQTSADQLYTRTVEPLENGIVPVGFRYGNGEKGAGGSAFWEQCAQWQSFQDYPEEAFTQDANVQVWLRNHHRNVCHEWHRYASYWFPYYYTEKHGYKSYSRLWKDSRFPEDAVEAYCRLYCDNNFDALYRDMYDYSARCANYDFKAVHRYVTEAALNYGTKLFRNGDFYQVAYENCPGTTGFNLIPLNVPAAGTIVKATLHGLTPGSPLAPDDPGTIVDGDGRVKGNTKSYNEQTNKTESFRFGYIAIDKNDKCYYGTMKSGKDGEATMEIPNGTIKLYFLVLGAPQLYHRQVWDDDERNDEQWPYKVKFEGTDLLGNVVIPAGEPTDIIITHNTTLDATSQSYLLGTLNLLSSGDMGKIAKAFKLQPTQIASATLAPGTVPSTGPTEGKIAVALTNPDGTLSYSYSANGTGFWVAANGTASSWGDSPVYFEYNYTGYSLSYGHKPGTSIVGTSYTIRPTLVYNKGGKLYRAVIKLQMNF